MPEGLSVIKAKMVGRVIEGLIGLEAVAGEAKSSDAVGSGLEVMPPFSLRVASSYHDHTSNSNSSFKPAAAFGYEHRTFSSGSAWPSWTKKCTS